MTAAADPSADDDHCYFSGDSALFGSCTYQKPT